MMNRELVGPVRRLLKGVEEVLAVWYRVEGCPNPECRICEQNRRLKKSLEDNAEDLRRFLPTGKEQV